MEARICHQMREEEFGHPHGEFWSSARGVRRRQEGRSLMKVRHQRIHACEEERSQNAERGQPQGSEYARQLGVQQGERPRGRARQVRVRHHLVRPLRLHAHAMWACYRQGQDEEELQMKRRRALRVQVRRRFSPSGRERRKRRVLACARHDAVRLLLRADVASRQRQRLPCGVVLA